MHCSQRVCAALHTQIHTSALSQVYMDKYNVVLYETWCVASKRDVQYGYERAGAANVSAVGYGRCRCSTIVVNSIVALVALENFDL